MPQLPVYEQRVSAQGPLGPGPQGDLGFDALAQVGQQIGSDLRQVEEQESARAVASSLSELRLAAEQDFLTAQTSAADGAEGFVTGALKGFDSRRAEIAKKITNPRARRAFLEHADTRLRGEIGERAIHFEAEQGLAHRVAQEEQSLGRRIAAVELQPDSWVPATAEHLEHIENLGLEPASRERARFSAISNLTKAAARGYSKRDPSGSLAKLATAESGDPVFDNLDAEARYGVQQYARAELVDQQASRIVDAFRRDAKAGSQELTALSKSGVPSDLLDDVRGHVREGLGLLHAERRLQYADEVNELERSISLGRPAQDAESKAEALFRRNVYGADEFTNVLQAIDGARVKRATEAAELATIERAISDGARLDPRDKKVIDGVDKLFTDLTRIKQIAPGSDKWINAAAEIAAKTNILPASAMSWARTAIVSSDPKLVVPAANAMTRWADAAPAAYAYFEDKNIKSYADQVDGLVRAGTAPARAVEIANTNVYEMPKERREKLDADYKAYQSTNGTKLQERLDSDDAFDRALFSGAPKPSAFAAHGARTMQEEYEFLVRSYFYKNGGAIDSARDLAWKDIRGTYGYSTVNGEPEILKYAPELMYPGIDVKVIRDDVAAVVGPKTWDGYPAIRNDDGIFSTRLTATVKDPALNGGKPTNIPTIWKGMRLEEPAAIAAAVESGQQFPAFKSVKEAVTAAKALSDQIGASELEIDPQQVRLVPSRATGDTHGLVWSLQTLDKDGHPEVVLNAQNRPLRYAIPTDTERYLEAQEQAKRAAVEAARADRERRRQTQEAALALDPLESEPLL
jgi:hypothetical protein